MFDRDTLQEIWTTLSKNKLRTILTAFGVSWGILMLLLMLGAGKGLENGVKRTFSNGVTNSVSVWGRLTSKNYRGFTIGRPIQFNNADTKALNEIEGIDLVSPGLQLGGWRGANNVIRKNKIGAFEINGYLPLVKHIKLLKMTSGRFVNERDMQENRKVCVIGKITRDVLFEPHENPIGEYISIQGVYFKIVGEFKSSRNGDDAEDEDRSIYIPFSTFQQAFNIGDKIGWYMITAKSGIQASIIEAKVKALLRKRHNIHPNDNRAIGSWNAEEEFNRFNRVFKGIELLSWFVGTLTLLAGIIGVSNIMLVIVKERTKELGIRRAIGATPVSIVIQIILESLLLTMLAGAGGFIIGIVTLENLGRLIQHEYFSNPEVNFNIAVTATFVLMFSGILAGILPAVRAVKINPIEALRTE